ncbi:MAG: hypothetical protein ABSD62_07330 [Candidatus Limnocylindrales bacterium]
MDYTGILTAKREQVSEELEQLKGQLRGLSEQIGRREQQLKNLDELLALEGSPAVERPAGARPESSSFLDLAAEIVRGSQSGVYYRDLLQGITSRGVTVPGQDPAANLIAHLTRDSRFIRTGRGVYGLRDVHVPAVHGGRRRPQPRRRTSSAAG